MIVALLAATVLMADAATTPPPANAAAQAEAAKKKPEGDKLVCKSEQVIGSRLPVKKCRTVDQAAQDKADAREQLDRAQGAMANNPH
jgi:hypothetical protein